MRKTFSFVYKLSALALLSGVSGWAQQPGIITTVAGGASAGEGNGPAASATFTNPFALAFDSAGNVYIADEYAIRKLNVSTAIVTTVAGTGTSGTPTNGTQATATPINEALGVWVDTAGNVTYSDYAAALVSRVTASTGVDNFVAGVPNTSGYSGDGSAATSARLSGPGNVIENAVGDVYIADSSNNVVRFIDHTSGIISTIVGTGTSGSGGDGGPALSANLAEPLGLALDSSGNLYISEFAGNRIRRVDHSSHVITTVVGTGTSGYSADGTLATAAAISEPFGVAFDSAGLLYFVDRGNSLVRRVETSGSLTTIAGNHTLGAGFSGDGGAATSAQLQYPFGIAIKNNVLYIADSVNNRIRSLLLVPSAVTNFATEAVGQSSTATTVTFSAVNGTPSSFSLAYGSDYSFVAAACTSGANYASCPVTFTPTLPGARWDALVAKDASGIVIGTANVYGVGQGPLPAITPGTISSFSLGSVSSLIPNSSALDPAGNLYIADSTNGKLVKITANGTSLVNLSGLGGNTPSNVAVDGGGNLYVTDSGDRLVEITPAGTATAVATSLGLGSSVGALAISPSGDFYVADTMNNRILRISHDGTAVTALSLSVTPDHPVGLAFDGAGDLFISNQGNASLAEVTASNAASVVTPSLPLQAPQGLATDPAGNLYVADAATNKIYRITPAGTAIVVAGTGSAGITGDGGPATSAQINPYTINVSPTGNLYIGSINSVRFILAASLHFPQAAVGQSSSLTLAVTDIGNTAYTLPASFSFNSNPSAFSLASAGAGDCTALLGSGLASDASCTLQLDFSPTAALTYTDTLHFASNLPVSLSGTGLGDAISLSQPSLSFGTGTVGAAATTLTLTLTNTANSAVTLGSFAVSGANAADFTIHANTCVGSLAASATCSVTVAFAPSTTASEAGALTFSDTLSGVMFSHSVTLSGSGSAATNPLVLSANVLNFANQTGVPQSLSLTLTNSGTAAVSVSTFTISGANAADFTVSATTCGASLAAAATCSVTVTYTATVAASESALLAFTDSVSGTPFSESVSLTGVGLGSISPSSNPIALSSSALSFGTQTDGTVSAAQTVTLSNNGSAAVSLANFAVTGGNGADFTINNNCGSVLAGGASCSVSLTFTPSIVGAESASLTFSDTYAGTAYTPSVALSGTGSASTIAPATNPVSLSATALNFGTQVVGFAVLPQTVTITNNGTSAVTLSSITTSGASDFSALPSCTGTLGAGASCSITVTYIPSVVGSESATISFSDTLSGATFTQSVALSGTGMDPLASSALTLSLPSLFSNGAAAVQTITLTDNGAHPLTLTSLAISGTNAADFAVSSNCGGTVAANSQCTLNVEFKPTVTGNETGTLTVNYADSVSQTAFVQTVALNGVGTSGLPTGPLAVINRNSAKALDVVNISTANGAGIQQYDYLGLANQQWQFTQDTSGYYTITNVNSGKVLDDTGYSTNNGTPMQQWESTGADNQKWTVTLQADGSYTIANKLSGKLLDVTGLSTSDGALIQQWAATGGANQSWSIIAAQQYFTVTNKLSGKVLDVTGYSKSDGTQIQQWASGGTSNQKWQFVSLGNGYYQILNGNSGKVLDANDASGTVGNGTLVQQYDYNGGLNQQWQLIPTAGGYYEIVNRFSGKVLDVLGYSTANGASIQVWSYLGGDNQQWSITPAQ